MTLVLTSLVASLLALLALPAGPARADTVGWTATGPEGLTTTTTTVSNGLATAAEMTYESSGQGYQDQTWTFVTEHTEPTEGQARVSVPWSWRGFHAYHGVGVRLEMIVNGEVVADDAAGEGAGDPPGPVLDEFAAVCCETPSTGFDYGGVAVFALQQGDTYGFRLTGRNFDSTNVLRGTFTLATKPFVDAGIGAPDDNRQWTGAREMTGASIAGRLLEPGEARWFRFPVVPNQNVRVDLGDLPADYDVALYGDIQQAFDRLTAEPDLERLAAGGTGTPGASSQVPDYPTQVQQVPTEKPATDPGPTFAPRIYAPRIYAPRIYAPRIYAPRIYAPRIYAPRIYAPGDPNPTDVRSNEGFQQAFTTAQSQALLAVSASTGRADETVSARTGNTQGFFYVRVQGHNDRVFSTDEDFTLTRSSTGGDDCGNLSTTGEPVADDGHDLPASTGSEETLVLTDSSALGLDDADVPAYLAKLEELADATDGLVVDVSVDETVRGLWSQANGKVRCPFAVNLVAERIRDIAQAYRTSQTRYVVVAGGDDVIPFFRYPDVSGLGQESQFSPPMRQDTPSGVSLAQDQVLSQDAYGSDTEVTISGVTFPVPDLAVGRLVKTPEEIEATVDHFLDLDQGTLPQAGSSLVTGYDFLEDAARRVDEEFKAAIGDAGVPDDEDGADQLITPSGTPYDESWTAAQLKDALLARRHDLVYLAGHFSANDTLAADFETTLNADELAPYDEAGEPTDAFGAFTDALVLSAGCHSGYPIVDGEAETTDRYDWTQLMAQQHAVLVGGTGYQYGDTEFLEYSERIYLNLARQLRRGTAGEPVRIGEALMAAKRDYLASLVSVHGIDQKAVLQATMYGLPMTGIDVPGREGATQRTTGTASTAASDTAVDPDWVGAGPGVFLALRTADRTFDTPTDGGFRLADTGAGLPDRLTWLNGADGVSVLPGAPVLPKQVENVTAAGTTLRGVGFRGGSYEDAAGLLPLTGAPGIEGSTAHTTFESPTFWPQRLATPNYFDTLRTRGSGGRTSLVLTPAQYRSDPGGTADAPVLTNTRRAYSDLDVRLFYSNEAYSYGGNQPFQAAPPALTEVQGTWQDDAGATTLTFSARATGDPSAGVQEVWVTWTGDRPGDVGHGEWSSVDLRQDDRDTSLWTGTLSLPAGTDTDGIRFLAQAANGVGAVGLDTGDGDGYRVSEAQADTAEVALGFTGPVLPDATGIVATVTGPGGEPQAGRVVRFTVVPEGVPDGAGVVGGGTTDASGKAVLVPPLDEATGLPVPLPVGAVSVTADLLPLPDSPSTEVVSSDTRQVSVVDGRTLSVSPTMLMTRAGTTYAGAALPVATLTRGDSPVAGVPVTFTLPTSGPRASFAGGASTWTGVTDALGRAAVPAPLRAGAPVGTFPMTVAVDGLPPQTVVLAATYALTPFAPPVGANQTVRTRAAATVPLRTRALLADGSRLDDATAAALVAAGRVEVMWRASGPRDEGMRTDLATYDRRGDRFVVPVRPASLGMQVGRNYTVWVRIRPGAGDLTAPDVHLGARSAVVQVR